MRLLAKVKTKILSHLITYGYFLCRQSDVTVWQQGVEPHSSDTTEAIELASCSYLKLPASVAMPISARAAICY